LFFGLGATEKSGRCSPIDSAGSSENAQKEVIDWSVGENPAKGQ
jgi:hypothetical protein